jgi:hypothetical protein
MVFVQLNTVSSGSMSHNCGIFSGQNIQNSWDSHTPFTSSFGSSMGDFTLSACNVSWLYHRSVFGLPIYDQDVKGNHAPLSIR